MEILLAVILGAVFLCGLFSLLVGGTRWLGAEGPKEEEESSLLFWMGLMIVSIAGGLAFFFLG